jgi:hypothetical protein
VFGGLRANVIRRRENTKCTLLSKQGKFYSREDTQTLVTCDYTLIPVIYKSGACVFIFSSISGNIFNDIFSNFQILYSQFIVCFTPSNLITHVWKRTHAELSEISKTRPEEIQFLPQ